MKSFKAVAIAIGILALCACASQTPKAQDSQLEKKIEAASEMQTHNDVAMEADYLIRTSPNLSEAQKASLLKLRDTTRTKMTALQEEAIKLRAVLMRDVLSPNYDAQEVAQIKARMKRTEERKLSVIFAAVDKANTIIGRGKLDEKDHTFDEFFIFDTMRIVP